MRTKPNVCSSYRNATAHWWNKVSLKVGFQRRSYIFMGRWIDTVDAYGEQNTHLLQLSTFRILRNGTFFMPLGTRGSRILCLRRVNSHWHVLPWCDAGLVNAAGWRWQWWLNLPARWCSTTLPPPRLRLPQSAFSSTLHQAHDHRRPVAAFRPLRSP